MKGVIVTVNYNNCDVTVRFIDSIRILDDFSRISIIIIDNSTKENDSIFLSKYITDNVLQNITILRSEVNRGYFGAVAYAVSELNFNLNDLDFFIISNNDIIIEDAEFFTRVNQSIQKSEIVAPGIISLLTQKDQNPYREREITKLQKLAITIYFSNYVIGYISLILWLFKKIISGNSVAKVVSESNIYSGHGSFIILSGDFFRKGGFIDNRLFLYGEEEFITAIAKRNSMNIRYMPDIKVFHDEHKTTNSKKLTRKIYQYQKAAYKFIKREYPGIY